MKKKLLVLTSTFPRWKNDTIPPFVYELSKRLTNHFEVYILTPHYPESKKFEIMHNMHVYRFRYFIEKYEKLANHLGMLPILRKNRLFYFEVPFFLIAELIYLNKLVKKIKPDIIHAHWIVPQGFVAALTNKFTRTPYIITSHGGDSFGLQSKLLKIVKKFSLKNAKSITVVSTAIKKELRKLDKTLKIDIIPMGVDSNLFNPNKRDESIKSKYNIEGPFLLFVGRLTYKKGVSYLIEAMPLVLKKFPNAKLLIIGNGILENELMQLTKSLKLEKNVVFTGPIQNKELPRYYATADIFVGPSIIDERGDAEGLPVTLMEALASGCFVVTTDLEGNRDIIKDGKNGFLVEERNPTKLAEKILFRIYNKKIRNLKKTRRFEWKEISNRYCNVLIK